MTDYLVSNNKLGYGKVCYILHNIMYQLNYFVFYMLIDLIWILVVHYLCFAIILCEIKCYKD